MNKKYKIILADPPWEFSVWGKGATRNAPYPCMNCQFVKREENHEWRGNELR